MKIMPLHPFGAVPSLRQREWHTLEFYGFLHFTVNTFTDREWGYGDESPETFNPSAFDAHQIVESAKLGGMRGLILTAKHHDGFCLWPSRYTTHSVASSPWRNGHGDVVREIADACATAGLKFGIYLSPWDRNHPEYGRPAYITYYRNQLRELLSEYGPLFEVWFDGANGGDGYYGGANEVRKIDAKTYYEWEQTFAIVRELQPNAVIFSDGGPDIRWVGNEKGIAGDPCWSTIDTTNLYPGLADPDYLNSGERHGPQWIPAECDVSIRPGWFYHQHEDDKVRTPENLMELYFASVGRGANLLVNLPVDPRGQVHELDRDALIAFHAQRQQLFATNLAHHAIIHVSSRYHADRGGHALTDNNPETYWVPAAIDSSPHITVRVAQPTQINVIDIREYLPLGQRVDAFVVDAETASGWQTIASAQSIGHRRLIRCSGITATAVRIQITQSSALPAIQTLGIY
ncbi:MAG: alpha-L-fucosidase [Roseiflexaceae bacterium]